MQARFLLCIISLAYTLLVNSQCPNSRGHFQSAIPSLQSGEYSLFIWSVDLFSANSLSISTLQCLQSTKQYATIGLFVGFPTFSPSPYDPTNYSSEVLKNLMNGSTKKELILYVSFNDSSQTAINTYISTLR